jgi:hypothetical protein
MKQLISFLFGALLSVNCLAQSFVDTNKVWHVGQWSGLAPNFCYTQVYQFKQDSIVNNQTYSVLKFSTDSTLINWYEAGLFREDTMLNRVYWLINNQEELLYDFNLNVGDTAKVASSFGYPYPNCGFEMIVDSIAYHDYFGVTRKHWYFNTPYYNNPEIWIEGIGNLFGPIENKVFICLADYLPDLLCYSEGSVLKWINGTYNDCTINSTGISEDQNSFEINCLPNPSSDIFQFQTNSVEEKLIHIFNAMGECVYQTLVNSNQFELQLDKPGIYFMKVSCGESNQTLKLLKL